MRLFLTIIFLATIHPVSAQIWTQTSATTNFWSSIACSADGSKLVAVAGVFQNSADRISPIYVSTNYGSMWIQTIAPSNYWSSVASSADGNRLVAVVGGSNPNGLIYTSTNGGTTWMVNPFSPNLRFVASSADGSKLFALSSSGQFYIATNSMPPFGLVWIARTAPNGASTIASSSDGTKLIAGGNQIYTSTNSGITWVTNNAPSRIQWSVASSADGTKLAAVDGSGGPAHIYTSPDSGTTWVSNNVPLLSWQYIAMSADGTKLIAAAWIGSSPETGPIYTSTNSGLTWISNNVPNVTWQGVACSADGNEFIAISAGNGNFISAGTGRIWISQTTPSPHLNVAPTNCNLALSWTIPSTNFVLQQSSDLASWTDLTNAPVLNLTNLQNEMTLPLTNGGGFYRLKTP